MDWIFFESDEAAQEAAERLRRLGGQARATLAGVVERQCVRRRRVSATLEALHDHGFIFVSDLSTPFERIFEIRSALAGEEALWALLAEKGMR